VGWRGGWVSAQTAAARHPRQSPRGLCCVCKTHAHSPGARGPCTRPCSESGSLPMRTQTVAPPAPPQLRLVQQGATTRRAHTNNARCCSHRSPTHNCGPTRPHAPAGWPAAGRGVGVLAFAHPAHPTTKTGSTPQQGQGCSRCLQRRRRGADRSACLAAGVLWCITPHRVASGARKTCGSMQQAQREPQTAQAPSTRNISGTRYRLRTRAAREATPWSPQPLSTPALKHTRGCSRSACTPSRASMAWVGCRR
jgi:hypothetical protein